MTEKKPITEPIMRLQPDGTVKVDEFDVSNLPGIRYMPWDRIENHTGEKIKALVFGFWDGEINGKDEKPDMYLAEWTGSVWSVFGTDCYSANVVDVTHFMPVYPPTARETQK